MSSPFAVKVSDKAKNELRKLPEDIQQRIVDRLAAAQADPFRYFFRLKGRPDYKLRIGDYRAIADIDPLNRTIEVTKIDHRGRIYKQ